MNCELQRQIDVYRASRARMGAPITPRVPVVAIKRRPPAPPVCKKPDQVVVYVKFDSSPLKPSAQILDFICEKHGLTLWQLKSKSRSKYLVRARWEAAYLIYDQCRHLSLPQVGKILCRDHSTILHGIREYAAMNGLPLPRSGFEVAA
jgi:hypothetical protein